MPPYVYALLATLCFSFASVIFSFYSRRLSPQWMNAFKCIVAFVGFSLITLLGGDLTTVPNLESLIAFLVSGCLGLMIGDQFLLRAFSRFGPSRTLMIFSFQPVFLGTFGLMLFDQRFELIRLLSVALMMACVLVFSYEGFRKEGRWEWVGPLYAILGVTLDSVGILLTRYAFETSPEVSVVAGNFYRILGALVGFFVMNLFIPLKIVRTFKSLPKSAKLMALSGSILGTVVSLFLYLNAVRVGHLATISAIAGTAPLFATLFECLSEQKWPSRYWWMAFILFGAGFSVLVIEF